MIKKIPDNVKVIIDSLQNSTLVGIRFDPEDACLRLDFTFGPEGKDVTIELSQVIQFNYSAYHDSAIEDEGLFYVGEVALTLVENGGKDILTYLRHMFCDENGVASYTEISIFHLHIEGSICMDVVCGGYDVLQSII